MCRCVMSHLWTNQVLYMNESCLLYEWVMSPFVVASYYDSQSASSENESCLTYECVMSPVWMSHVSYTKGHTRWRRLIGSPKLQIIFHKRATKYRSLLRKMTYTDKGSYESSPPCILCSWHWLSICLREEWVMSHVWMSHVSYTNASCLSMNESCQLYEWVMSHVRRTIILSLLGASHVPSTNE